MLRLSVANMFIIFLLNQGSWLNVSVQPTDGGTLEKSPTGSIQVIVGQSFNLTCSIGNLSSTKSRAWARVQNKYTLLSVEDQIYFSGGNYKVYLSPDYTVIITNATKSMAGRYYCGIVTSDQKSNVFLFKELAGVSVFVLPGPHTTAPPRFPRYLTIVQETSDSNGQKTSDSNGKGNFVSESMEYQQTTSEPMEYQQQTRTKPTVPQPESNLPNSDANGNDKITGRMGFIFIMTWLGLITSDFFRT